MLKPDVQFLRYLCVDKGWVSEAQLLPYVELSEVEKDKDRLIVRAAIEASF